jgi:hypothetical protein
MRTGELVRGVRILRSAPWVALLGGTVTATVLLTIAALADRTDLGTVSTFLGLSVCGGTAAYILDDETGVVADATPTSRPSRTAWRMPILLLPVGVALAGLFVLDRLDPATHWWWLGPLAMGAIATGVALAAAFGRDGGATPGDLAGVITVAVTVLVVALNPLRHWVAVAPLDGTGHAGRSLVLWIAVIAICGAVTLASTRDPGHRSGLRRGARPPDGVELPSEPPDGTASFITVRRAPARARRVGR